MTNLCYLVWIMIEDEDGCQDATWDGEFECMVIVLLVAVCDDKVIAEEISDSVRGLKVWTTERPMNTVFGKINWGS